MDVTQIRRKNYEFLFDRFKESVWARSPSEPERGMLKLFASQLGFSDAYLSHINTGYREIGLKTARKMEKALRLAHGWMDVLHDDSAGGFDPAPAANRAPAPAAASMAGTTGEQAFIDAAVKLYREDPNAAQSALLAAFAARFVTN
ncbi:helix-turn-helix domain-containing protein [Paraburkholderia phosphatilytica]|uniref:helix-turn-helix domain-containing protein n=1 Tax=Paraburkholderia phosphatilytica TaxID=2282883 RepID=UPI000E48200B|nr:helix-turn-helix transcriptional regulator [Paraburkholderia phosphatilytica]